MCELDSLARARPRGSADGPVFGNMPRNRCRVPVGHTMLIRGFSRAQRRSVLSIFTKLCFDGNALTLTGNTLTGVFLVFFLSSGI